MSESLFDIIPGYRAAVDGENEVRDLAYLGLPRAIVGIQVNPLTPRSLGLLTAVDSPFVRGRVPKSALEIIQFLWILSPANDHSRSKRNLWRRRQFARGVARKGVGDVIVGINKFLEATFQDSPGANVEANARTPYASWIAHVVHVLGKTYGWSYESIIDVPLEVLFQQNRIIEKSNNPQAVFFNPSDKVRSTYLKQINGLPTT